MLPGLWSSLSVFQSRTPGRFFLEMSPVLLNEFDCFVWIHARCQRMLLNQEETHFVEFLSLSISLLSLSLYLSMYIGRIKEIRRGERKMCPTSHCSWSFRWSSVECSDTRSFDYSACSQEATAFITSSPCCWALYRTDFETETGLNFFSKALAILLLACVSGCLCVNCHVVLFDSFGLIFS